MGFAPEFELKNLTDFQVAKDAWKDRAVAARKSGDEELETTLNVAFSAIKPIGRKHCPKCGGRKGQDALRCRDCFSRERSFGANAMGTQFTEWEIEKNPVLVPPSIKGAQSALSNALEKLCTGTVGDSFVTRRQPSSIALSAKMRGLKIICRCITPHEKDPKKRAYRVWRSDGHSMDALNEIIRKRLNGDTVTTSPVTPPSEETVRALRNKKHPQKAGSRSKL